MQEMDNKEQARKNLQKPMPGWFLLCAAFLVEKTVPSRPPATSSVPLVGAERTSFGTDVVTTCNNRKSNVNIIGSTGKCDMIV